MLASWKKSYDKPRWCIEKQTHYFVNKRPYSQRYGFSSSHVLIWELDHKEGWEPKNWCFQIVVLVKTLVSPLDSKEIKLPSLLSLQSCLTLCDPIDGSLPGSPVHVILQVRTLEWVANSFSNAWKWKVKVKLFSRIWLLVTPWTAALVVSNSVRPHGL